MNEQGCETFASDCQVRAAVELISHTWDPVVLSALRLGPTRRSALLDRVSGMSDKALTESLRRLTARRLVGRTAGAARDAAVYELTELGASFARGPLVQLGQWAADNQVALAATS
jgi:DNA-binding HxlR family transcriptional regulator